MNRFFVEADVVSVVGMRGTENSKVSSSAALILVFLKQCDRNAIELVDYSHK